MLTTQVAKHDCATIFLRKTDVGHFVSFSQAQRLDVVFERLGVWMLGQCRRNALRQLAHITLIEKRQQVAIYQKRSKWQVVMFEQELHSVGVPFHFDCRTQGLTSVPTRICGHEICSLTTLQSQNRVVIGKVALTCEGKIGLI